MKRLKLFFSLLFILYYTIVTFAQADCPDFKSGKSSNKLNLLKKIKKSEAIIKFSFDYSVDLTGD